MKTKTMGQYSLIKVFDASLVGLQHWRCGLAIWVKITLRKPFFCAVCLNRINAREEAYRPNTNRVNRGDRICISCMDKFIQLEEEGN